MPNARSRPYLLCYDIADPKRLQRVHRVALKQGLQWQYSVYFHYFNEQRAKELMAEIEGIINPRQDDVRLYPVPLEPDVKIMGRKSLSSGIHLPELPLPDGFFG